MPVMIVLSQLSSTNRQPFSFRLRTFSDLFLTSKTNFQINFPFPTNLFSLTKKYHSSNGFLSFTKSLSLAFANTQCPICFLLPKLLPRVHVPVNSYLFSLLAKPLHTPPLVQVQLSQLRVQGSVSSTVSPLWLLSSLFVCDCCSFLHFPRFSYRRYFISRSRVFCSILCF